MFGAAWTVLFVLLILIGLLTIHPVVIALGAMGLAVEGVSWLWNRLSLERLTYQRSLGSNHLFMGDETVLTITIRNSKPVPLTRLDVEDSIPVEIEVIDAPLDLMGSYKTMMLRHSTSMGWYEQVQWQYTIKCNQRGFYRLGPARLVSGDLFGFFSSERLDEQQDYLVVYPRVVPLPGLSLPPRRPLGEIRGGSRLFEDISRPATIRDYQPGDSLKSIDWKATAKRGSPQVRQYDPSEQQDVVVLANANTSYRPWEGYSPIYLERVVTASASVASLAVESRYGVGLFSNGAPVFAKKAVTLVPSRDPKQLSTILEILASVNPMTYGTMADLLASEAHRFSAGSTLVLVTAVLPDALIETMEYLAALGHKPLIIHLDDEEPPPVPDGLPIYRMGPYFAKMESPYAGHAG